jgi:uncharacterized membrane protein HdeD (DUF308 family)
MSELNVAVQRSSKIGIVLGILTLLLGVLAITAPMISGMAVSMVVAFILIAAGICQTIFAFRAETFGGGILALLFGGFSIIAGGVMLARPLFGLASLTMVLVAYFLIDGVNQIAAAFRLRPTQGWGWMAFSGALAILLAILIWREWPLSGAWAIGVLVGIRLIMSGWAVIFLGTAVHRAAEEPAT